MDRPEIDWERLDRYVAGEGTPEELDALRRWVEADPELQVIAEVLRTAQRLPGTTAPRWEVPTAWRAVAERLGLPEVPGDAPVAGAQARSVLQLTSERGGRRWWSLPKLALAAAAAVIAVLGAERWVSKEAARPAVGPEWVALRGQRLVVHLPDRTEITLAPETRLRLSPDYGQGARAVSLEGKAYFVVTHDAARPFSVQAGGLIARDLGTRFVVRAYPTDSTPDVIVAEGTVALGRPLASDSIVLEAGDRGRVTRAGGIARSHVAVEQYLAWTDGKLVFRDAPLRDVVLELGRWYDLDVRLDSAVAARRLTASFNDAPVAEVLRLIAASLDARIERTGKVVTIGSRL